jgi:hypothetical protein
VLRPYLNIFYITYIDDVLIYNKDLVHELRYRLSQHVRKDRVAGPSRMRSLYALPGPRGGVRQRLARAASLDIARERHAFMDQSIHTKLSNHETHANRVRGA